MRRVLYPFEFTAKVVSLGKKVDTQFLYETIRHEVLLWSLVFTVEWSHSVYFSKHTTTDSEKRLNVFSYKPQVFAAVNGILKDKSKGMGDFWHDFR